MKDVILKSSQLPPDIEPKLNCKAQISKIIRDNPGITNHEIYKRSMMSRRMVRNVFQELLDEGLVKYDMCGCYDGCPIRKYQIRK